MITKTAHPKPTEVVGLQDVQRQSKASKNQLVFLFFHAAWSEDASRCLASLRDFFDEYLVSCRVGFVDCDLEANQPLCSLFEVDCVPTAVVVSPDLQVVKRLDDIDLQSLYEDIETLVAIFNQNYEIQKTRGVNRIQKLLRLHDSVLFLQDESSEAARAVVGKLDEAEARAKIVGQVDG